LCRRCPRLWRKNRVADKIGGALLSGRPFRVSQDPRPQTKNLFFTSHRKLSSRLVIRETASDVLPVAASDDPPRAPPLWVRLAGKRFRSRARGIYPASAGPHSQPDLLTPSVCRPTQRCPTPTHIAGVSWRFRISAHNSCSITRPSSRDKSARCCAGAG